MLTDIELPASKIRVMVARVDTFPKYAAHTIHEMTLTHSEATLTRSEATLAHREATLGLTPLSTHLSLP